MKKIIPVLLLALTLSACGERESAGKLRQICEDDVKNAGVKFDCNCQIDIFKESLSAEQMDTLAKFIETERTNKQESLNISKQPGFEDMFKILVNKAPEIEKKCRKAS